MPRDTSARDQFLAGLDEVGEDEVRLRLRTGRYGNANGHRQLAEEWVDRLERSRSMDSSLEHKRAARSANTAAWVAAIAATIAAICAIVSILISLR